MYRNVYTCIPYFITDFLYILKCFFACHFSLNLQTFEMAFYSHLLIKCGSFEMFNFVESEICHHVVLVLNYAWLI